MPVVLDLGSADVKAGFAGDPEPKVIFPSVVGVPRKRNQERMFGEQAIGNPFETAKDWDLSYPISNGIILNWDYVEMARTMFYLLVIWADDAACF